MTDELSFVAELEDEGARADVVLARRHPELTRRVARRLALAGHLVLDGRRVPPSTRVRAGQRLQLRLPETATPPPVRVLAVTPRFVYVDKPAGLPVHRLGPEEPPALADAVAVLHPECAHAAPARREGGAAHRLDIETTGVVAFARDRAAWLAARAAFAAGGGADKRYVALSTAPPETPWPPDDGGWWHAASPEVARMLDVDVAVEVGAPLGGGPLHGVAARADGQPAHTTVGALMLARGPARATACFVLRLHTGRRHQARVHLACLGWPILGDHRYAQHAPEEPLMLHAARLDLGAALPGEPAVEAPWPGAMLRAAEAAAVRPPRAPGLLPPAPA